MTTTETAELLARECAKAIRYSVTSDHPETILQHIPLVELLNVAAAAERVQKQLTIRHPFDSNHINHGGCHTCDTHVEFNKSINALRAKLPKGAL